MTSHGGYLRSLKKKIVFRVDASDQIGTGHLMRCMVLADRFSADGACVRFVSQSMPVHLIDLIKSRGHDFFHIVVDHSSASSKKLKHSAWLASSQTTDAKATLLMLSGEMIDLIVVDHYALDVEWERLVRKQAKHILVIDDLADREHDCDTLLDQNLYSNMESRYVGRVSGQVKSLLGPKYALLRNEFRLNRSGASVRDGAIQRILVFLGGVDKENYTSCVLDALLELDVPYALHVDVVIGSQHPCKNEIELRCKEHGFFCHVQTNKMAELIIAADIGVGAGGSASWERCCLGLPSLVVSLADNQIDIAENLDRIGACIYLGYFPSKDILLNKILDLMSTPAELKKISKTAFDLVDGRGVDRVYEALS